MATRYEIPFRLFFIGRRAVRRRVYSGGMKRIDIRDGQTVSAMGKNFTISVSDGAGKSSRARTENDTVNILLAEGIDGRQKNKHVSLLARKAISKSVMPDLAAKVDGINARHFCFGLSRLGLKDQKGRWGSYSKGTNSIYLNFRLLFAPEDVLDYVIVHELAHIKELNHSRNFWRLVENAMPDYKEKRKWLRKNGAALGPSIAPKPPQS
ncbi:Uncharacterised protein [uncultured archaeon]|nr:Uncharacterised protein [uncultured archaeon]